MRRTLLLPLVLLCLALPVLPWGTEGHTLIVRLALRSLPSGMPAFFVSAQPQLEFLSNEPDRWRDRRESRESDALRLGSDSDHWFEIDLYGPEALPPQRYAYYEALRATKHKPEAVGQLPYKAMELFQRMRLGFRRWRRAEGSERGFLEARILEDAGLLAHYIGDGAMPLHTSSNYNGWFAAENPKGYSTDRTLHARFEGDFVKARVKDADVRPLLRAPSAVAQPLSAIYGHLRRAHAEVVPLYEQERRLRFDKENGSPETLRFVATRLADGASTLRDLWWTAWTTSADAAAE